MIYFRDKISSYLQLFLYFKQNYLKQVDIMNYSEFTIY